MTEHTPSKVRPGDFPLGSALSRAAARAEVQALKKLEGPKAGDIQVSWGDVEDTPEERARLEKVCRIVADRKKNRCLGGTTIWLTLPDWFVVPESAARAGVLRAP